MQFHSPCARSPVPTGLSAGRIALLDRKFIRENHDLVTRAVALKRESIDIDAYYAQDAQRRAALQEME